MKPTLILTALAVALLAACKSQPFKSSAARETAGAASKTYAMDVERVWQSLQSVMRDLDLDVETSQHDALGGEMTARRAIGDEVHVRVRSVAPQSTSVDVLVEPGEPAMAQMIQDRLAAKLGADRPVTGVSVGSMVEGTYPNPLDECAAAADRALKALNLPVDNQEKHDIWCAYRSRHLDTIPVGIKMVRTPKDETQVQFSVGTSASDDNRILAERLKKEFETALGGPKEKPRP
jgi:hypothetical protein